MRHFVLVPCEICVVPFGHWKIAPDRNDISIANRESIVKSLTHACASLRSLRLATLVPMRRKLLQMRLLGSQACVLLVCIIHACASFHSFKHGYLSLQKCSLFGRIFGESSTFSISHVAKLVTNRVSLLPGSLFGKYLPT